MIDAATRNEREAWLTGGDTRCAHALPAKARPWHLVLLGAPGIGKGTQAELLTQHLGACQLSTGDIFRAAKQRHEDDASPALAEALAYMKRGELVPDATVLGIVKERATCLQCHSGFLFDGFPRTAPQAEALEKTLAELGIKLDAAITYVMPIDKVAARISGRRVCPQCKAVFHVVTLPPQKPDVCDHCGAGLIQREDDRPEAVRVRMEVYETATAPLIDFYKKRDLLVTVSAEGRPDEVLEWTLAALERRRQQKER